MEDWGWGPAARSRQTNSGRRLFESMTEYYYLGIMVCVLLRSVVEGRPCEGGMGGDGDGEVDDKEREVRGVVRICFSAFLQDHPGEGQKRRGKKLAAQSGFPEIGLPSYRLSEEFCRDKLPSLPGAEVGDDLGD